MSMASLSAGGLPIAGCGPHPQPAIEIQIGTPPQSMWVLLDTGSSALAVATSACTNCPWASTPSAVQLYNPLASSSAVTHQTSASQTYGASSTWGWSARQTVTDIVQIAGMPPVQMTFALIDDSAGFLPASKYCNDTTNGSPYPYVGILGAVTAPQDSTNIPAGVDGYMTAANHTMANALPVQVFGICNASSHVWLNGFQPGASFTADVQWVDANLQGYDNVALYGVTLGEAPLTHATADSLHGDGVSFAYLDNGTDGLWLLDQWYEQLIADITATAGWQKYFGSNQALLRSGQYFAPPAGLTAAELNAQLPKLTFYLLKHYAANYNLRLFGDITALLTSVPVEDMLTLNIPAVGGYLSVTRNAGAGSYWLSTAMFSAKQLTGNTANIFGVAFQQNWIWMLDPVQQRIGFHPSTGYCPPMYLSDEEAASLAATPAPTTAPTVVTSDTATSASPSATSPSVATSSADPPAVTASASTVATAGNGTAVSVGFVSNSTAANGTATSQHPSNVVKTSPASRVHSTHGLVLLAMLSLSFAV